MKKIMAVQRGGHAVRLAEDAVAISRCFAVMQELRPHLASVEEFTERVERQMTAACYRLAYTEEQGEVAACAGFRVSEWLAWGKTLYVDDLVTREAARSHGHGESLIAWLKERARAEGCGQFHLDSGTHRLAAHRFYHRMRLSISSFHFACKLGGG